MDLPRPDIQFTTTEDGVAIAYWEIGSGPPFILAQPLVRAQRRSHQRRLVDPRRNHPEVSEAHRRLLHLREHGPTATGWPLTKPWPTPGS